MVRHLNICFYLLRRMVQRRGVAPDLGVSENETKFIGTDNILLAGKNQCIIFNNLMMVMINESFAILY